MEIERQIAEEEEGKGEKVRVRYGKIWIGNELWFWDEEREELRDGGGRKREEVLKEGKRRGEEGEGK